MNLVFGVTRVYALTRQNRVESRRFRTLGPSIPSLINFCEISSLKVVSHK